MRFPVSGYPSWRVEDERLLAGEGRFLDDLRLPDQAHAAFIRSPHAHARIGSIDGTEAMAAFGVVAVLTGADYAADGLGLLPCGDRCTRRDGTPMPVPPHPALPVDRVRFVGEAVAMVVAQTEAAAREAAELVRVEYDPLETVTATDRAGEPGAAQVWEDCPANEAFLACTGDPAAFDTVQKNATHVVDQRLDNRRVTANSMEPRGAIGVFDAATACFTLHAGVHSPHQLRGILARDIFRLPEDRFRVIAGDVGGSFGMRGAVYPELILVLWAARRLGRPVRWIATRCEGLISDDHGRDMISDARLALDAEGRILGLRVAMTANLGAYLSIKGPRSPLNALSLLSGVYRIPVFDLSVAGVYTHTNSTTPYRGAGGPEAAYILERLLDKAARTLGIDRVALRRRNLIAESDLPYDTGTGWTYDSGAFEKTMDQALQAADVAGFADRRRESERRGMLRGIGICNAIEQTARPGAETARIEAAPDGRIAVLLGTAPQGQGHETVFRRIVCEALGIGPGRVSVRAGDTAIVTSGGGTFNSRSLVCGGTAALSAFEKIVEQGREIASDLLEASITDIDFADGRFTIAGTDRSVTLGEVAAANEGLAADASFSSDSPTFPNGTHVCEVEIDPQTGRVAVVRYTTVDDVGTVIDPLLLEGQMHGGIVQGIGQALMEEIRFEEQTGQNLTGSFMDYAMPRADDLCAIEAGSNPVPTALNPLGSKGAGEAGTVGALPAVMCAIVDALAPFGAEDFDMPATAERIWRVLSGARAGGELHRSRQDEAHHP